MYNNLDTTDFLKAKRKGKIGETAVIEHYKNNGCNVIDVSEDEEFQNIGVDLIIDGDFVEVKTQDCLSKRKKITLELETEKNNSLIKPGWFYSTKSNILIFYDNVNNIAYSVDTKELRDFYIKNRYLKDIDLYSYDEKNKVSQLVFIPIDLLKKQLKSFKTEKY